MLGKIEIDVKMKKSIMEDLAELQSLLSSGVDLRKILRRIPNIQMKIRTLPEYYETPENRFSSFLIWSLIGETFSHLEDKTENWYEENKKTIDQIQNVSAEYFKDLKVAIDEDSFEKIITSCMVFFSKTNKLALECTVDTKQ